MNEKKALRELQRGSQRALEWFIERYNAYVSTIVYQIIGHRLGWADLEETVSDVFVALWRHADKVQPDKVRAYIGTVARNAAKSKLRSCGQELALDDNILVIDTNSPERILERDELQRLVRQAVLSMEYPDREIFLRFYFYGQKLDVICEALNLSLSAVKSRLFRGREKLKKTLVDHMQEGGI